MYKKKKTNFLITLFFSPKALALVGLLVVILLSFPLARVVSRRYQVSEEIRQLEREIADIENKNKKLEDIVGYLGSDQFIEEQARLNLGLKKPEEEVAVIKTGDEKTDTPKQEDKDIIFDIPGLTKNEPAKPLSNPRRWWRYFFGDRE